MWSESNRWLETYRTGSSDQIRPVFRTEIGVELRCPERCPVLVTDLVSPTMCALSKSVFFFNRTMDAMSPHAKIGQGC